MLRLLPCLPPPCLRGQLCSRWSHSRPGKLPCPLLKFSIVCQGVLSCPPSDLLQEFCSAAAPPFVWCTPPQRAQHSGCTSQGLSWSPKDQRFLRTSPLLSPRAGTNCKRPSALHPRGQQQPAMQGPVFSEWVQGVWLGVMRRPSQDSLEELCLQAQEAAECSIRPVPGRCGNRI